MAWIRRVLALSVSRLDSFLRPGDGLMPPLHLRKRYYNTLQRDRFRNFANGAAQELLERGLKPQHRVLDVGCGIGPLAIGLIPHLTTGSYEGLDVHGEAIAWCQSA